jgi:glycosyltransferase involved in cell wall biosynthesis
VSDQAVSVVVPTRNARRTIASCLASVRAQTSPVAELILVDNWSDDGTWELALPLADLALRGGPERSAQRNLGIARAAGDWVLWLDADMELAPDSLERALAVAADTGATGVFLPEMTDGSGFWAACRTLERRCYHGEPRIESPRLLRAGWLREAGGFVGDPGTEDADLRNRLLASGATVAWADTLVLHHEGRVRLGGVARKRFYYGRGLPGYRRRNPGAVSGQAGATAAALWRHRQLLAADPAHAAGLLLVRGVEAAAYLAGALSDARPRSERSAAGR